MSDPRVEYIRQTLCELTGQEWSIESNHTRFYKIWQFKCESYITISCDGNRVKHLGLYSWHELDYHDDGQVRDTLKRFIARQL